ncbi:MAG: hypothetical protein RMI91_03980 [Gemmatales bacterium]|nr:hypothetical protein [Gemmatales bacterium]MDW7993792.1 hypothetical protein [Gemmatales bacterium]
MSQIQNNRVELPLVPESETPVDDIVITDVYRIREEAPQGASESEEGVSEDMSHFTLEERVSRLEDVCEELGQRLLRLESQFDKTHKMLQEMAQKRPKTTNEPRPLSHSSWLVVEIGRDLVWTWHMFRDVRYQVSWTTIVLGLVALVYLTIWPAVRSWLGWGWSIPIISYVDNLVVAYLGLKALSRELRRYEDFVRERGPR